MEPYSLDILATPASSRLGYSTDETSNDEETNDGPLDLSRLQHVYQALMSTIVDLQQTQQMETSSPNEERQPSLVPEVGQQDDGVRSTASGAAKNAKRRKMDKKKAKREEQKRSAEETVDVVG
ncbi:hypothetical protein QFC19_000418 [Naganishia cerealis]|uniref:Uncharacterized protein n=1 Tax=Naganishia cerealis TaxID=610337 RepID=A0ACC2WN67_9TREE|nr:hypothetical protein QFC19_000418 [Naganishia cerealis]